MSGRSNGHRSDDVLESLKPLAAFHEVLVHAECKPLCIYANARQMTELLGNLLSNAIKYNKPGGEVWVTITEEKQEMIIRVRDNGMGIPKESPGTHLRTVLPGGQGEKP